MWLVPVRPGAAVDWASERWLDALDEATTPHLLPPQGKPACEMPLSVRRAEPWTSSVKSNDQTAAIVAHGTASDATTHAAQRGYLLTAEQSARIAGFYQDGWQLVALELGSSAGATASRTLRVSDDGGAVLPLALTGGSRMRMTVFAIGAGAASVSRSVDTDRGALRWGVGGSTYDAWRRDVVETNGWWLREASSHDALFDGTPVPGTIAIPSVIAGYFEDTRCAAAAWTVRESTGAVGTTCAPGSAARIPGGAPCVASEGSVDPALLSCSGQSDLALALSNLSPLTAVLTRWSAAVTAGAFETNRTVAVAPASERPAVVRAASFDMCMGATSEPPPRSAPPPSRPPLSNGDPTIDDPDHVVESDGCGGGAIVASDDTFDSDETEAAPPEDASSESCSSDGSSGWDESDDSDGWDDSEGCSHDDSSSSDSSDGCSSDSSDSDGWDTEDDDSDGWDTEDEMSPSSKSTMTSKKPHAKRTRKKASPVSRFALLGAAILLPLRRRRRDPVEIGSR